MGASGKWHIVAESVRGAAHERSGLPNQDAVASFPPLPPPSAACPHPWVSTKCPALLAVSDGHGSPRCFRSARGAAIAVQTALAETSVFLRKGLKGVPPPSWKKEIEQRLPSRLVRCWRSAVEQDILASPFTQPELAVVNPENPYTAYGATLLLAAVERDYAFFLQIGDGDIVVASGCPPVSREPIEPDSSLIANETHSLCQDKAAALCRFRYLHFSSRADWPSLILLSTDGYSNSFANRAGFLQSAPDLALLARKTPPADLRRQLGVWLKETSEGGSGDDVTLGIIYREGATCCDRHACDR
jgi:hypothetical protein